MEEYRQMLYPLVKTFLGKKCYYSHRKTLVNNILFVAKGIKPSYLVDNVSLTGQSLHAFVQAAIQLDHLFEDLVTVTIEECELFVVNRKASSFYTHNIQYLKRCSFIFRTKRRHSKSSCRSINR